VTLLVLVRLAGEKPDRSSGYVQEHRSLRSDSPVSEGEPTNCTTLSRTMVSSGASRVFSCRAVENQRETSQVRTASQPH
jgi:hypothetical protein